jgi:hypothetical protein
MKNFFKLEVFKDGVGIFDKMVPTILIAQTVGQWSAPELGYAFRLTFDSGKTLSSDQLFSLEAGAKGMTDFSVELEQEINLMNE